MDLRNSIIGNLYYHFLDRVLLCWMQRLSLTPNVLTFIGLLIAVFVPLAFYFSPLLGFLVLVFSAVTDSLDGLLARKKNIQSKFGAFLDSTIDRISDFFYLCGFWVLFWLHAQEQFLATIFVFSAFLFTILISYTKARMEGLAGSCNVGIMDRSIRTLYLLIWALTLAIMPDFSVTILWIGLACFWFLTLSTVVQRICHAYGFWKGSNIF